MKIILAALTGLILNNAPVMAQDTTQPTTQTKPPTAFAVRYRKYVLEPLREALVKQAAATRMVADGSADSPDDLTSVLDATTPADRKQFREGLNSGFQGLEKMIESLGGKPLNESLTDEQKNTFIGGVVDSANKVISTEANTPNQQK